MNFLHKVRMYFVDMSTTAKGSPYTGPKGIGLMLVSDF